MLGDKELLTVKQGQKTSFINEYQESKFVEMFEEKEKEIKELKKTIKKLTKELKQKNQAAKLPIAAEGPNSHFKILLQRELNKYNELKNIVNSITQRLRKLTQDVNQEYSLSQNSESMENFVKMLEMANISQNNNLNSQSSKFDRSSQELEEDIFVEQAIDEFEIIIKSFLLKSGQINKMYKQSLQISRHTQQQLSSYKKELKNQRKGRQLLQKLLQKNETQKNELVNQINSTVSKEDTQELKSKTKQDVLNYCFKLNYRIKDLEKEKEDYIKSSTKDKQKEMKLYQALLSQVKNIKERSRIRQSVA